MLSSSENKKGPEGWGQASNLKLHRGQACTLPLGYTPVPTHNFAVVLCIGCWQWSSRGLLFIHFWLLSTCHTVGIILGSGCYGEQQSWAFPHRTCFWGKWNNVCGGSEKDSKWLYCPAAFYGLSYLLKWGHSVPNLFLTWHFYPLPLTVFFPPFINNTEEICLESIVGRWAMWLKYRVEVSYWRIVQVCILGMFHNLETLVVLAPGAVSTTLQTGWGHRLLKG